MFARFSIMICYTIVFDISKISILHLYYVQPTLGDLWLKHINLAGYLGSWVLIPAVYFSIVCKTLDWILLYHTGKTSGSQQSGWPACVTKSADCKRKNTNVYILHSCLLVFFNLYWLCIAFCDQSIDLCNWYIVMHLLGWKI